MRSIFSKGNKNSPCVYTGKAKELINIHIDKENWVNYGENTGDLNDVEYLRMFINLGHHKRVLSKLGKQLQEEEIKEEEIKKMINISRMINRRKKRDIEVKNIEYGFDDIVRRGFIRK